MLDDSVLQRRREIGIRVSIGGYGGRNAGLVTIDALFMVVVGAIAGIGLGKGSVRYIGTLLYEVHAVSPGDTRVSVADNIGSGAAGRPSTVWRSVRIDPVTMLRADYLARPSVGKAVAC